MKRGDVSQASFERVNVVGGQELIQRGAWGHSETLPG